MSRGNGVVCKVLIMHVEVLQKFMYVVYEHFEYRRKLSTFLRLLWSNTVSYIRVFVKVAEQFTRSLCLYCVDLLSISIH